jgi:GTP-binding protein
VAGSRSGGNRLCRPFQRRQVECDQCARPPDAARVREPHPGRTQQIVFFALRDGARAADLPGYGYAAVSRDIKRAWQQSLWDYVTTRSTLVGLALVVDARHGLKELDLALLDGFVPSGRPALILATKSDKLNFAERRDAVTAIRSAVAGRYGSAVVTVLAFSAETRLGVEEADAVLDEWLP